MPGDVPLKMEVIKIKKVGIDECIHIEFEYNRS